MEAIRTVDVQHEIIDASAPEELIAIMKKYPSRILATVHFSVDSRSFQLGHDVYFDHGRLVVEK